MLHLRAFSKCERILAVDPQVPNGALDFEWPDPHGPQAARQLVNDRDLGSSQRMRPLGPQSDSGHPVLNEPSILPGADMIGVIDPARKANSSIVPSRRSSQARMLPRTGKLNWPAGPLLDDDRARAYLTTSDDVADLDLDDVTSAQLAVDRQVEHRAVA